MSSDNSRAREAASLGVVLAWLNPAGGLENRIRLSVDAHPDVFPAARSRGRASDEASRSGTMPRRDPLQVRVRPNRLDVCFGDEAEMSESVSQPDVFLTGEGNNFFDRHVETYDSDPPPLLRKSLEFYCRYPKPDHGVLEIGCSSGRNLHYLQTRAGCSCFGIDPSEKAVRSGRDRFPNAQLSVGTAERLEFADGSLDFVLFGFCLYLIDRPLISRVVAEADRVLKNQRFLGITGFDPPSPVVRPYKHQIGVNTYKTGDSKPLAVYSRCVLAETLSFSHTSPGLADNPREGVFTRPVQGPGRRLRTCGLEMPLPGMDQGDRVRHRGRRSELHEGTRMQNHAR